MTYGEREDNTQIISNKTNKFKNIEFLRFFLAWVVVIHHVNRRLLNKNLFGGLYKNYLSQHNGNKAVEFFFIISGFFLIYGFNKNLSTFDFIKKKIIRLSPLMLFFNIIYIIISLFTKSIKYDTYNNILSLLFLGNIGVTKAYGNLGGFVWHVSVLFWVSFLYFYLLKYFERKNINLFSAISIWFSYVFMIQARNGNISNILKTYNNIFVVGLLRGLGGMGIGYFIASIYKDNEDKIENMEFNKITTFFITLLEVFLFSWSVYYLIIHKMSYRNNIIFILFFIILFILFLIKKGLFTKLLDNNLSVILGRYSYSIYITHFFVLNMLRTFFWKKYINIIIIHPLLNVVMTMLLVLISSILVYHLVEKPSAEYLRRKWIEK